MTDYKHKSGSIKEATGMDLGKLMGKSQELMENLPDDLAHKFSMKMEAFETGMSKAELAAVVVVLANELDELKNSSNEGMTVLKLNKDEIPKDLKDKLDKIMGGKEEFSGEIPEELKDALMSLAGDTCECEGCVERRDSQSGKEAPLTGEGGHA